MKDRNEIHLRYLQDPLPTQLMRLAAYLQRIASLTANPDSAAIITGLIAECILAIEWSAPDLTPERAEDAAYLVDVQRALVHWQRIWQSAQVDPVERTQLAEQAREWSIEILYMSGLVDE